MHIAITKADGSVAVMTLLDDAADDKAIDAEITKASETWVGLSGVLPVKGWRRMGEIDVTAYRAHAAAGMKAAMIDNGKTIALNPVKRADIEAAKEKA